MIVLHGIWGREQDSKWRFYLWRETSAASNKTDVVKQRLSFKHPFKATAQELHKVTNVTSSSATTELVLPTFKMQNKPFC